ncbi:MAG TPA: VOC family protein [Acidimicrobiales bacterium]|nr:VOC family protein [Acidimicrobiales bacterium]
MAEPTKPLTIGSTVLGVDNVARAMKFWMAALDYEPLRQPEDDTWVILVPREGTGAQIALALSETPVQDHPRHHLDLYAPDQAGEVERLVGLGAKRVDWDGYRQDSDFIVLEDTEGNRFCVIDTSER